MIVKFYSESFEINVVRQKFGGDRKMVFKQFRFEICIEEKNFYNSTSEINILMPRIKVRPPEISIMAIMAPQTRFQIPKLIF